jgi:transposase InsO family protein
MDRDTKFSKEFRDILENIDVKAIRLPPRSPNLSPHLERFMRSIKEECLERMIFFGEKSRHTATLSYTLATIMSSATIMELATSCSFRETK